MVGGIELIDKEKVMLGLKCCAVKNWDCISCPYGDATTELQECHDVLLLDAYKLLEEQECVNSCTVCQEFTCDGCKILGRRNND